MAMSHIQTYYAMRCKIIYYYVASSIGNSSVAAGIVIVFLYLVSKYSMYSLGTSEEVAVCIKQNGICIVEAAADNVPRQIQDCPYEESQRIPIVFKYEQPAIESHSPAELLPRIATEPTQ